MKRTQYFFSFMVVAAIVVSCSKSNEADLRGNDGSNTCDTVNMKFSTDIKPILENNCYACHSNANFAISGFKLEDYDNLKEHVENGDLIGTITHAAGFPAMPESGPKLSDCNINKIKAWVNNGAINN